jgi:hypothetical protein
MNKSITSLIESLIGEVFVADHEVLEEAKVLADKIYAEPKKRRNRTYEQVLKCCIMGRIAEIGVKKMLGAEDKLDVFNDTWDINNRESYGCDLILNDMRIEVKSQAPSWFAIPKSGLKTLRNNIDEKVLDAVITASYKRQEDGYVVKPRVLIDPYKMLNYMKQSNFSEYKYYYDHHTAGRAGDCIIIQGV